jgi:hypothetical protein
MYQELGPKGFTVVAVALDSAPGAAVPWIEQAAATYPCLIDREHRLAELYNLVNVPSAVWIDEAGRIVRPPEPAGAYDFLNRRAVEPDAPREQMTEMSRQTRRQYLEAVRDWVARGRDSAFVMSEQQAQASLAPPDASVALAHASFRLGQHLTARGREAEGRALIERAKELHPDSWAMWREAATKLESGIAAGPDFMERVRARALENKPYYAPIDMPGIPR